MKPSLGLYRTTLLRLGVRGRHLSHETAAPAKEGVSHHW